MPIIELEPKRDVSNFQKIAIGTWRMAYDPSVYGTMEFTMDKAMEYIVIRKMLKVNATFDHRFIDGFHAAAMSRTMKKWLADPYQHFGPIPS